MLYPGIAYRVINQPIMFSIMKRSEPTIVQKVIQTIDGFEKVYKTIKQQVILQGRSQSTLNNYIRRIALISLHFGELPENISEDEINEYLTSLALEPKSPSRSSFKHAVYGLRYYYRYSTAFLKKRKQVSGNT